jgi:glycosyltransferase involved in cell wall biosynthesis
MAIIHCVREAAELSYGRMQKALSTISSAIAILLDCRRRHRLNPFRHRRDKVVRRILYIQFADPAAYPPIEHSSQILAERGWDVVLLGSDAYGNQSLRLSAHPRILVKTLSLAKAGGRQSLHYICFFFWCLYWTCTWRPVWIYASDPLALPAVWLVRQFTRARIVYHEHDSPNEVWARSWFMRAVLMCRKMLAREVELCILPQQERLIDFSKMTGRRRPTICVWNCPRLGEIQRNGDEEKAKQASGLVIYYHGSINGKRLPEELVVAASRFKGAVHLRITGYEVPGSTGYVNALVKLAAENGAPGIIEFLGIIPFRKDLLLSAAKAHVGLSLMPKQSDDINLRDMVGASNKPFDYMACGLALLVTDLPEWKSTFVIPGYGRACDPDSVDSIEAELNWYLSNSDQRREMGRRCADQIRQSWNYDIMFGDVLTILERY